MVRKLRLVQHKQVPYEELYRAHYQRVMRLCRLLLPDAHEAEDVGQEVLIKMFRQSQAQNSPAAWNAWVTRVTINACRDRRRSRWWKWWQGSSGEFHEADFPSPDRGPEEAALQNEQRGRIWRAFRQLSSRQKEIFVLRHIEGWSTEEVAESLRLTTGSVKRHLFRAVRHLRGSLGGSV